MNSYRLHSMTASAVMGDKSGIALFSGCSGRSAFLKLQNENFATQSLSTKLLAIFSSSDIQLWLNIDDKEISKLETWLVENKFIIKHLS